MVIIHGSGDEEIETELFHEEFYGIYVYGTIAPEKPIIGVLYTSSGSNGFFLFKDDKAKMIADLLPEGTVNDDGKIDEVYKGDVGQKLWEDILKAISIAQQGGGPESNGVS